MTLVSACLIVKNEERFLPGCLASLAGIADELVIVDTGSTDRTLAIAAEFGARVFHHAWNQDYAAARNVGLAEARGAFILYVDADEEVHAEDRHALRAAIASNAHDAILMRIVSPLYGGQLTSVDVYPRAFRNYPDARFRHRIHEQIWPSLAPHAPRVYDSPLRILHHGYAQSPDILNQKRHRNLEIALAELRDDPNNGFYLYQAGFACLTLGRPEEALRWLERSLRHTEPGAAQVPALNAIAQAHVDAKNATLAVPVLLESTKLCPLQFHGWGLLADIYLQSQRHADAAEVLARCLSVEKSSVPSDVAPSRPLLELKLGLALLVTHHPTEAEGHFRTALAGALPEEHRPTAERYLALAQRMTAALSQTT